jgi:hypothetical protein
MSTKSLQGEQPQILVIFVRLGANNTEMIRRPGVGLSVAGGIISETLDHLFPEDGQSTQIFSKPAEKLLTELKVKIISLSNCL